MPTITHPATVTTSNALALASWWASLLARGYRPGPPREPAASIDRALLADADCPQCHRHGLEYHPFTLDPRPGTRGRYIALGLCPACQAVTEF
jgi:hypothetical protein